MVVCFFPQCWASHATSRRAGKRGDGDGGDEPAPCGGAGLHAAADPIDENVVEEDAGDAHAGTHEEITKDERQEGLVAERVFHRVKERHFLFRGNVDDILAEKHGDQSADEDGRGDADADPAHAFDAFERGSLVALDFKAEPRQPRRNKPGRREKDEPVFEQMRPLVGVGAHLITHRRVGDGEERVAHRKQQREHADHKQIHRHFPLAEQEDTTSGSPPWRR